MHILSTVSYDVNTTEAPVKMFEYFLYSENRQTFFYSGDIASLKHLIRKHDEDLQTLESEAQSALLKMYNAYYKEVSVEVKANSVDGGSLHDIRFDINIINYLGTQINVMREFTLEQYRDGDNSIYKKELK